MSCATFLRQQGLAQWKVPREIYVETDFPRNPTGKVLKARACGKNSGDVVARRDPAAPLRYAAA
jgi:non-ribosomal peptide synthetase component E (peptide arylation enzyme)